MEQELQTNETMKATDKEIDKINKENLESLDKIKEMQDKDPSYDFWIKVRNN